MSSIVSQNGQISNSSIIKSVNVMLENGFSNHKTVV